MKQAASKDPVTNKHQAGIFDPEDRGDMFFRKAYRFSPDYTPLYPRRQKS
jgi:hypothetical protein